MKRGASHIHLHGSWQGLRRLLAQRLGMARPSLLATVAFDCFGIVLDRRKVIESARAARQVFGAEAAAGATTDELFNVLGQPTDSLPMALRALVDRGSAFRLDVTVRDKGRFEVIGAPRGTLCLVSFRPLHSLPDAVLDPALALGALSALPLPVSILGADGGVIWRNGAAASGTPGQGRAQHDVPLPGGACMRFAEAASVTQQPAEDALRRFVETVSETFAHLRVGLAIFDRDRRLTLSNPAMAEMFHVDARWLSGRPTLREMLDHFRESRQLPEQADFPAWRATLFTLFDSGGGTYEEIWELPDGRSLQVLGRPHPVGGIAFVFEDITESLALQRWRSTAMEVRRATLDLLADGVVVFGADGRVRIANPAFMAQWGLRPEEVPTLHVAQIAAACGSLCRDVPLWERVRGAVASGFGRQPWEARATLTDGRVLKVRVAPMPDGSTLVALADVTDSEHVAAALRDRAAALEAAEQMRDTLVDHLSHRLRTPLNAVVGFSEMLSEGRAGALTEMQAGFISNIRRAARQLMDGIEGLGDLASIHAGPVSGATGAVALGPALRGALGLLARRAEEMGVGLTLASQTTEPVVWGDTARVRQTVYALVAESVSAACPGSRLRFGATAEGETVALWSTGISGNDLSPSSGSGISAEMLDDGTTRFIVRLPVRSVRETA